MSSRGRGRAVGLAGLALTGACVGATTPPPEQSTTTTTGADVRIGSSDRDAALARARRRLEVATREIGVIEHELSQRPTDDETRRSRDVLRRAEQKRAELDAAVSRIGTDASWSPERRDALDAGLDELDALVERARK